MDSIGKSSSRSAQGFLIQITIPHSSSQKGAATALPHCDYSCGQYCHPCRAAGRWTHLPSLATSQSASSVRSYQNLRHATNQYRSYYMQCSLPCGSYDTTSRSTQSPSSPTTRSATSCGTKMLLEESPNGQSNSAPSTSTSSHEQPSSRKH
jgi:hypothetical protein